MDHEQRLEQFSRAYIRAVASISGLTVYEPEVDDDSIDMGLAARGSGGSVRSPRVELQVKGTRRDLLREDGVHFPLKVKNYHDLQGEDFLQGEPLRAGGSWQDNGQDFSQGDAMRATIRDAQTLAQLRPLDLAAYLRYKGWQEKERSAERFSIWTLDRNGGSFEVLLPLTDAFRDYPARIGQILRTLELAEERSQIEILANVATTFADLVRVRVASSATQSGSIGFEEGIELMRNAREMMLAAACATVGPRRHYPTRKPTRATEYLESLELGQTEAGSFVVTILSPVPPALQASLFPEDPASDPFERHVTKTLVIAARAARRAAEESVTTGRLEPFEKSVELGVSANLCDALSGLHEAGGGDRLALDVTWASARLPNVGIPSSVHITRDAAQVFKEASRIFKEIDTEDSFELMGYVIALKRDEGQAAGVVTVSGLVEGQVRKVRLELDGTAYERAIEAHGREGLIRCEGTLAREGLSYVLRKPLGFRLTLDDQSMT